RREGVSRVSSLVTTLRTRNDLRQRVHVETEVELPDAALVDEGRMAQQVSAQETDHPLREWVLSLHRDVAEVVTELRNPLGLEVAGDGHLLTDVDDDDRQLD